MAAFLTLIVLAVVAAAVAYPLWRPRLEPPAEPLGPGARLRELEQRKDAHYAAIRELGFDYRTGKLTREDYEAEVEGLKAEAAEVIRAMEELRTAPPRGPEELESTIAAARRKLAAGIPAPGETARFCTHCGRRADAADRFCAACGTPLREAG